MVDYREILRLQSLGHNITQIAGSLHNSRNTVSVNAPLSCHDLALSY